LIAVKDAIWAAAPQTGFAVLPNQPVANRDFVLRKSTRVFGTLTNEQSQHPIPNQRVVVYQYGQDLHSMDEVKLPNPGSSLNSLKWVCPSLVTSTTTDQLGRFEFFLGDGKFDIRPPKQGKTLEFEIAGEQELVLNVTTNFQSEVSLTGKVVRNEDGIPVGHASILGVPQRFSSQDWQAESNENGVFLELLGGVVLGFDGELDGLLFAFCFQLHAEGQVALVEFLFLFHIRGGEGLLVRLGDDGGLVVLVGSDQEKRDGREACRQGIETSKQEDEPDRSCGRGPGQIERTDELQNDG